MIAYILRAETCCAHVWRCVDGAYVSRCNTARAVSLNLLCRKIAGWRMCEKCLRLMGGSDAV